MLMAIEPLIMYVCVDVHCRCLLQSYSEIVVKASMLIRQSVEESIPRGKGNGEREGDHGIADENEHENEGVVDRVGAGEAGEAGGAGAGAGTGVRVEEKGLSMVRISLYGIVNVLLRLFFFSLFRLNVSLLSILLSPFFFFFSLSLSLSLSLASSSSSLLSLLRLFLSLLLLLLFFQLIST